MPLAPKNQFVQWPTNLWDLTIYTIWLHNVHSIDIGWDNLNTLRSSQDGGVGRNPLFPHTTKRRITTNLKLINNQKCQKIKLHRTRTTKKLKKKSTRTTRPVHQDKEIWPKWKNSKTSERELSDEQIANLSGGKFKALVIKMLTELTELGQKIKNKFKKKKDTQNEIKQNIQGTNSDRKETRTQSNNLEQKGQVNIQRE